MPQINSSRLNLSQYNKIIILFIITFVNIGIMWYFLIRPEGLDWISTQVLHQTSPYNVTASDNGKVIIDNITVGYGFSLPPGFKTVGARNFSFFMEENGRKKCEIRHYYVKADKTKQIGDTEGKITVPLNNMELVFELVGGKAEEADCAKYLKQIKANLTTE